MSDFISVEEVKIINKKITNEDEEAYGFICHIDTHCTADYSIDPPGCGIFG